MSDMLIKVELMAESTVVWMAVLMGEQMGLKKGGLRVVLTAAARGLNAVVLMVQKRGVIVVDNMVD